MDAGKYAAVLLVAGCANGFAVDVAAQWHQTGVASLLSSFGVSPLAFAIVAIGALVLAREARFPDQAEIAPGAIIFCILTLIPSSFLSWVALGIFAIWLATMVKGRVRSASLLFAGLAAISVWAIIGEPRAARVILPFDAAVTAALLAALHDTVVREGNIVGTASGHQIIVLASCSAFHVLPLALLGWRAMVLFDASQAGRETNRNLALHAFALAAILLALGYLRLVLMAWSPKTYAVAHGPWGSALFDCLLVLAVITVAHATCAPRRGELRA